MYSNHGPLPTWALGHCPSTIPPGPALPMASTACMWPMIFAATTKPTKKNYNDNKRTNKKDYKKINKQATNIRLLQRLHKLHPLSI